MYKPKTAIIFALFISICAFICASIYSMDDNKKVTKKLCQLKKVKCSFDLPKLLKYAKSQMSDKEIEEIKNKYKKKDRTK